MFFVVVLSLDGQSLTAKRAQEGLSKVEKEVLETSLDWDGRPNGGTGGFDDQIIVAYHQIWGTIGRIELLQELLNDRDTGMHEDCDQEAKS